MKNRRRGSGGKSSPEPNFFVVGRVLRAWGIRGDVKIAPFTDRPEDFAQYRSVLVGAQRQRYEVKSFRPHQGNWLLHLVGVESRSAAEALHGQEILIEVSQRPRQEGEFFAREVIGLKVRTINGEELGEVTEILVTGANDVYVVKGDRGEILLPARVEVIKGIDVEAGVMTVELLPGLL
ncbi:MAG: 16S rRNA processing protein RimM [Chloroflexi bacterium]|nr:16S rRNA processing protein RimM [Chloroflexota bacterium]